MKTRRADIDRKMDQTVHTWETACADQLFADMALPQYKAEVQLARDTQARFDLAEVQWQTARQERNTAYARVLVLTNGVASSVKGHPKFGENSAVYAGLGYVPKSERSSGLTRKRVGEVTKPATTEPG